MNEKIAHLYEPTHPAIIRLIKMTVDAAHKHNIWVERLRRNGRRPGARRRCCIGLGVDELSAAPPLVPQIKFMIRRLKIASEALAEFALLRIAAEICACEARARSRRVCSRIKS